MHLASLKHIKQRLCLFNSNLTSGSRSVCIGIMGSLQSVFYPDNPNRRKRAQELADDCQYIQNEYDSAKKTLEDELGPYKEKLDKVLAAFGCSNVNELDQLILKSATGDALAHWENVRQGYDMGQT
jgi:hypothetical protein